MIINKNANLPAKKISNRMPCKIPHTIIMSTSNFNLGCFMPTHINVEIISKFTSNKIAIRFKKPIKTKGKRRKKKVEKVAIRVPISSKT